MRTVMDEDVVDFCAHIRRRKPDSPVRAAMPRKNALRPAHCPRSLYGKPDFGGAGYAASGSRRQFYRSQTLNFHAPVKIGDVVTVVVEVIELVPEGPPGAAALRGAR